MGATTGICAYLLGKLPVSTTGSDEDPAANLLGRTLAAYRARVANNEEWIKSRISSALAARPKGETPEEGNWIEQIAASTGLPMGLLQELLLLTDQGVLGDTASEAVAAILTWLAKTPLFLMDLVRPESLEGLFGADYKKLPSDEDRAKRALQAFKTLLPLWMTGVPLRQLEAAFLERSTKLGRCVHARHFVLRIVPELAFIAALPARLLSARKKAKEDLKLLPIVLATLGSIVREGCDSPEALATKVNCGTSISRVAARRLFDEIKGFAVTGSSTEEFEQTRSRMRDADALFKSI